MAIAGVCEALRGFACSSGMCVIKWVHAWVVLKFEDNESISGDIFHCRPEQLPRHDIAMALHPKCV